MFTTMFGLRVPISKCLTSRDFDGVNSILYNSSLREFSQWASKINKRGEIFLLELPELTESLDQISTDKDCLCTCSDCATDDTGYGTDSELYSSFRQGEDDRHSRASNILHDVSDFSFSDVNSNKTLKSYKTNYSLVSGRTSNFLKAEEEIDCLFRNVSAATHEYDMNTETDFVVDSISTDILPQDFNIFQSTLSSSDFMKVDTNSVIESVMSEETEDVINTSLNEEYPTLTRNYRQIKSSNRSCECATKKERSVRNEYVVNIKIQPHQKDFSGLSTVELCEQLLGIVPGHYSSNQETSHHHRRRDRRIKVRGIVPNGMADKSSDIHVGDCLLNVNDQDVTWDNFKNVLQVLKYQRQTKLVLKKSSKQKESSSIVVKKQSGSSRLVQLVTGANTSTSNLEDLLTGEWEPFYGALYLSLEGVNSDNMQAKDDVVYQFPRVDNKVIDSRGLFITLAGTLSDATQSTIQSTTLMVEDNLIHVVYHTEGQNLFVVSATEKRFSLCNLTTLVRDLVRVLEVTHGSVHKAFIQRSNHQQLDCFFALLHQNQITNSISSKSGWSDTYGISQSIKILPLANDIKICFDRVLSEFEAADFGDMGDSYYGCRRSYTILGSCLFYKNYLITNHLPKDDLVDFASYLRYHSLFTVTSDLSIGQLVSWKEVHPTRHCQSVPEEQSFGYTEPLIARWFWLIVGYKNMIICIMLEKGGCTFSSPVHQVQSDEGVSSPDPFLIDQARAVLMQLHSQNMPKYCQNSITSPIGPSLSKPDRLYQQSDLISKPIIKLPHKENSQFYLGESLNENHSALRRVFQKRKDSVGSDNSSESSGDSIFKFSRRGRLFPENTDILHSVSDNREELRNTNSKLTAGTENSLFHYQYYDNLEGILISSEANRNSMSQLNLDVLNNFQRSCKTIKKLFDNAKKVKEQTNQLKTRVAGLNDDFTYVREEGIMFTCESPVHDKKHSPLCYWVVGRCLSRSLRREVYVCFHESVPQTVIELAFKMVLGYLPV